MDTPTLTLTTNRRSNKSELRHCQVRTSAPHVLSVDITRSGPGSVQPGGSGQCETIMTPIAVKTELGSSKRSTYWLLLTAVPHGDANSWTSWRGSALECSQCGEGGATNAPGLHSSGGHGQVAAVSDVLKQINQQCLETHGDRKMLRKRAEPWRKHHLHRLCNLRKQHGTKVGKYIITVSLC